jgi:hypothetical protein
MTNNDPCGPPGPNNLAPAAGFGDSPRPGTAKKPPKAGGKTNPRGRQRGSKPAETPPAVKAETPKLDNALELWGAEAEATAASGTVQLRVVRLDHNEKFLIPFSVSMRRATLHFLESDALRGYVHCNGGDCLLCRIGRQPDVRDLLPVYDPVAQTVAVLPVSQNLRPGALRPLIKPVLEQIKGNRFLLMTVRKLDIVRYELTAAPLPEGADDGAAAISKFKEELDSGIVNLEDVYPHLTNNDLAAIPDVARVMQLKGITLS